MDITYLQKQQQHIQTCLAFAAQYPECPGNFTLTWARPQLDIEKSDVAKAGEVLGKEGWVRQLSYDRINWHREIAGVRVILQHAEDNDLEGTPVPPLAFPLLLKDEPSLDSDVQF